MENLFERLTPRGDVLAGELTESRFAASLEEVVSGTAPDAYGRADTFFAATHPSGGLRSLLNESLGRLGGGKPDGASVIRLETNLGGGKTHNLIALYHAARGNLAKAQAAEFMDAGLLPDQPVEQIGVFVGTSTGARSFPVVDGVTPQTLWGYLALQIGGQAGYDIVRSDDEAMTAPGSEAIKRLLGDRPTLLLIDEIARYYKVARGVKVGEATLAGQTTAFLMALMEAVDGLPAAALVITTTGLTTPSVRRPPTSCRPSRKPGPCWPARSWCCGPARRPTCRGSWPAGSSSPFPPERPPRQPPSTPPLPTPRSARAWTCPSVIPPRAGSVGGRRLG